MTALLSLIVGLFVTMVLLPPLVRVAGKLRLVDKPNHRKVHDVPIPRVGGIAIYAGLVVPLLWWAPLERIDHFYLLGGALIVLFGAVDDRLAIEFKWKFAGQAIATLVVMAAGIRFDILPFCGLDPVTPWITYPVSFLFILGVTNALNLSDGLDGLAAGSALLSLTGIGVLAYLGGGPVIYLGAVALAGAILGFLRFNTHPAVVFLGDAGSQFLGFALACMAIILTQKVNTALNPMLPLFIVGLPLLDTLSVILIRLWNRQSPFSADNRHFHHRLLKIGLRHYEAAAVVYSLQALAVALAFLLRYQSDALALLIFVAFAGLIYSLLYVAETIPLYAYARASLGSGSGQTQENLDLGSGLLDRFTWLPMASARYVQLAISAFLFGVPVFADRPPHDIAAVAAGVAAMMVFAHFFL
ncbi:MAG: glycosyltransferase family 4 protein, partial [Alphaproteobacteria bacterium]